MVHVVNEAECSACGACVDSCPSEAITMGDVAKIDPELCIDCGACVDACPLGIITQE